MTDDFTRYSQHLLHYWSVVSNCMPSHIIPGNNLTLLLYGSISTCGLQLYSHSLRLPKLKILYPLHVISVALLSDTHPKPRVKIMRESLENVITHKRSIELPGLFTHLIFIVLNFFAISVDIGYHFGENLVL